MSESEPARPGLSAVRRSRVLRSLTDVAMLQAADVAALHDVPPRWRLDRPGIGRVRVEREMGARPMVVAEVTDQDAVEVSLAEHEHVIQTVASDRADEPLHQRVLPRALRRRENLLDPQAFHAVPELLAIDRSRSSTWRSCRARRASPSPGEHVDVGAWSSLPGGVRTRRTRRADAAGDAGGSLRAVAAGGQVATGSVSDEDDAGRASGWSSGARTSR